MVADERRRAACSSRAASPGRRSPGRRRGGSTCVPRMPCGGPCITTPVLPRRPAPGTGQGAARRQERALLRAARERAVERRAGRRGARRSGAGEEARIRTSSDAYALNAIIDVAQNNRDEAPSRTPAAPCRWRRSRCPASLALSYALQADFELEAARDELLQVAAARAGNDRPEHALALARLAELWLSLGYVGKARDAGDRAAALAPRSGPHAHGAGIRRSWRGSGRRRRRPRSSARLRSSPGNPLAHLGLGLAKIRDGDLRGGRQDIETAAALDVEDAVIRSYLGKAYFEERRDGSGGRAVRAREASWTRAIRRRTSMTRSASRRSTGPSRPSTICRRPSS